MKFSIISVLFIVMLPCQAAAHLYWIEPAEFFYYEKTKAMDDKVSETLTFEFSGGDIYFNADTNRTFASATRAYTFTYLRPDGSALKPVRDFNGQTRHIIEAEADQQGTYTIAISRTGEPMYYSKLADDRWVEKAKDELTAEELTRAKVHGAYFQHSKSFVTLHEMTDAWKKPIGHVLEIMPLAHPNHVYTGDYFSVQVLYQGKPLAHAKLTGVYQAYRAKRHGEKPLSVHTDKNGKAYFQLNRAARWLLTVKHSEPLARTTKANSHEHQASLMLEVNEPWVKKWVGDN